jgi:hypothetical protein
MGEKTMKDCYEIAIVGGGAAGLMAAATLAQAGKGSSTVVLEQANRPGKKLLATGNGRCNLMNLGAAPERYFSQNKTQRDAGVAAVLELDQLALWEKLGLLTQADEEGRAYPACYQAAAVLELLRTICQEGGVELRCDAAVKQITHPGKFCLTLQDGTTITASQVILATGGKAAPNLGGTGGGYPLAQSLGHTVTSLQPGLVPLRCVNPSKALKGVRSGCTVSLWQEETLVERRGGEVQFTDYGVSGIVIMQLSNYLEPGKRYELELDLFPQMEEEDLLAFLAQKASTHPDQRADFLLLGVLKSQFSELLLRSCRVDGKKRTLGSLTEQELSNLARRIKHWRMKVQEPLTWEQAQVTLGGVALDQVDMTTFRSRNVPGLYFTGELLDVAGDCGGFNLAWAFGSGVVAARSALAERI